MYEFVVTATNEFGESLKEEKKRKKITVVGGKLRGIMKWVSYYTRAFQY